MLARRPLAPLARSRMGLVEWPRVGRAQQQAPASGQQRAPLARSAAALLWPRALSSEGPAKWLCAHGDRRSGSGVCEESARCTRTFAASSALSALRPRTGSCAKAYRSALRTRPLDHRHGAGAFQRLFQRPERPQAPARCLWLQREARTAAHGCLRRPRTARSSPRTRRRPPRTVGGESLAPRTSGGQQMGHVRAGPPRTCASCLPAGATRLWAARQRAAAAPPQSPRESYSYRGPKAQSQRL